MKRRGNKRRKTSSVVEVIDDKNDGDFIPGEECDDVDDFHVNEIVDEEEIEEEEEEIKESKEEGKNELDGFQMAVWNVIKTSVKLKLSKYRDLYKSRTKEDVYGIFRKKKSDLEKMKYLIEKFPANKAGSYIYFGSKNPLYYAVGKEKKGTLAKIYAKHYGIVRKLSRDAMVEEVMMKIYGEVSRIENRKIEDENIKYIDEILKDDDFRFFPLCGITLPLEIHRQILEYLPRNYEILTNVGGTCQFFYLRLLCSWNYIKVHAYNLYRISTLALRNVEKVSLFTHLGILSDKNYLFEHLNSKRLRKVEILGSMKPILPVLDYIYRYRKKTQSKRNRNRNMDYPFQNVTELNLRELSTGMFGQSSKPRKLVYSYSDIFPNLKVLKGINCVSSRIFLDKSNGIREIGYNINNNNEEFQLLKNLNSKQILCLRRLSIKFSSIHDYFSNKENIMRCLKNLPNLTNFEVKCYPRIDDNQLEENSLKPKEFDLTEIMEAITNLSFLSIQNNGRKEFSYFRRTRNNIKGEYYAPKIRQFQENVNKNLEILKIHISYRYQRRDLFHILDFNLEEFLESKFFHIHTTEGNLKEFHGDLSIFRRRKDLACVLRGGSELNVYNQFQEFLRTTIFNFRKFNVFLRSYDGSFKDEYISLEYHYFSGIRKMKLKYINSSNEYITKEKFEKHLGAVVFRSDKKDEKIKLILEERRPSLLLFLEILDFFVEERKIDILECVSVRSYKGKGYLTKLVGKCERVMRECLLDHFMMGGKWENVQKKYHLEKLESEFLGLKFTKKSLI